MKTPKISEILHLAADKHLWDGNTDYNCEFSCHAIEDAIYDLSNKRFVVLQEKIHSGLQTLGLHTKSCSEFDEFPSGQERQSVRYAWLKFAALLAEEQGV